MLLCNIQINALQKDTCNLECQLVYFRYLIHAEVTIEENVKELWPSLYRCENQVSERTKNPLAQDYMMRN